MATAAEVPVPDKIPTVAWNSPWVFRAEIFAGAFIGAYVLLAIAFTTVRTGRPPRKLSFGMISYEEAEVEKAADALNEGKVALQALQRTVDALSERVAQAVTGTRAAHENVLALAGEGPIADRARRDLAALEELGAAASSEAFDFDQAMANLEQRLRELDTMLARPRGGGSHAR